MKVALTISWQSSIVRQPQIFSQVVFKDIQFVERKTQRSVVKKFITWKITIII